MGLQGPPGPTGPAGDKQAIVPAGSRFVGLYCVEAPEVRFEDVLKIAIDGPETVHVIDRVFIDVCEPGSLLVIGLTAPIPTLIGAEVSDNLLRIRIRGDLPPYVVLKLSGIRAHRGGLRFPEFTEAEMHKNNAFWSQALR